MNLSRCSVSSFLASPGPSRSRNDSRLTQKPSFVNTVIKTPNNIVELYELPVPVLVEEAFSFAERNTTISAKIADCGYAWVVCGRKLLVWQYQTSSTKSQKFPICHELKLPHSELAHRAELVAVFPNSLSVKPSCVAVSPAGMVRYWPDISQDHCSVDQNVDLNGQECNSLVEMGALGCVFVTTTCTLVLVQYKPGKYEHQLHCRTLKTPGSWLGGLGKRVSSIFFGPISGDHGQDRIVRLLGVPGIQQMCSVYVLAGLSFQKWTLSDNEPEQLVWTVDLSRIVKEAFRSHVSHWEVCDIADINTWILDIQPDKEGVLALCAAVNFQTSAQVYYGLISIPTGGNEPPSQQKDFLLLKIMGFVRDDSVECLVYRFILCQKNAYVYSTKSITVIKPQEEPDTLEFTNPQDHIFGGCSHLNTAIFFSRHHGLVTVTGTVTDENTTLASSSVLFDTTALLDQTTNPANNISIYQLDANEVYNARRDLLGQLKAAFIFHVKRQLTDCYDIVNTLFPSESRALPGYDGPLDVAVVQIAREILDDIPAGDPRWFGQKTDNSHSLAGSYSMLVLQQIKDKQMALSMFIQFLKDSGLWDKLSGMTARGAQTGTIYLLAEQAERIVAAIILKGLPASFLLDEAIEKAVNTFSTTPQNGLSKQDVFFREISRTHEAILWVSKICDETCQSSTGPEEVARIVHEGNQIVLTVLNEVLVYRKQASDSFALNDLSKELGLEYCPWTIADGGGILETLLMMHALTIQNGIKFAKDFDLRNVLLEEFVMLVDIILDGKKNNLSSVKSTKEEVFYKEYCALRSELITPLLQVNAYEKVAILAEKYLDFELLVTICDQTNDQERLEEYFKRFSNSAFPEHVYSWYMKQGKEVKLLNRYWTKQGRLIEGKDRFNKFLAAYPALSWIQQTIDKDYSSAAETLSSLGENETQYVSRQKTMFSLSKLAKLAAPLASDTEDHVADINKKLKLISYQEQLPDHVLWSHGFDPFKAKVLRHQDVVALFISADNLDTNEIEFKKALEVVDLVDDPTERTELLLLVWRTALFRDNWQFLRTREPPHRNNILERNQSILQLSGSDELLAYLEHTFFFKLVDLCVQLGSDPRTLLPPIDALLDHPSLDRFLENPDFCTLMRAGYENFERIHIL